jgi:exopolysaccharide biosynthesis predicted pyruvyltransferase EpsI
MEVDTLKRILSKYRNSQVDFYRFPGNYGDSLIWHGSRILLRELNISENYVEIDSPKVNTVLFIDGGGNFVDYYSDVRNFLIKNKYAYKEVVILPHTVFGDTQIDVLKTVSAEVTVFCRERVSYEFVSKSFPRGSIYLWHDCAFYNTFPQSDFGAGVLHAFRTDKERVVEDTPDSNIDVSCNGYATKPLGELIQQLQQYAEICTDRLHVAICAALLRKKVYLFANSYYKNEAVYEYSLKKFPDVSFQRYPVGDLQP